MGHIIYESSLSTSLNININNNITYTILAGILDGLISSWYLQWLSVRMKYIKAYSIQPVTHNIYIAVTETHE